MSQKEERLRQSVTPFFPSTDILSFSLPLSSSDSTLLFVSFPHLSSPDMFRIFSSMDIQLR